jgi:uncharacterized caspase-like protein
VSAEPIRVTAIAYDDDGLRSAEQEIQVVRSGTAPASGRLVGLCVGVSRYADSRLRLRFPADDARAMAKELGRQGAGEQSLYRGAQVTALTDEAATREAVQEALSRLLGTCGADDTVVLFLSGHGWRDPDGRFYFATHEVRRDRPEVSALPWDELSTALVRLSRKARRVLVLLDACHSGSSANHEELLGELVAARTGALVLASSRSSEVSLESSELAHGLFAKAVLESLHGAGAPPQQRELTVLDLLSYVSRRVKSLSGGRQHPHVPLLHDFDTDAPLVLKR